MRLYWREARRGQRLIFDDGAQEAELGGVRETKRGFDAFAVTFGYDPGRAQKDISTLEEAKTFVESFSPWELYGASKDLTVEPVTVGSTDQ